MEKKKIILVLLVLLALPLIFAESSFYVPKADNYTIKFTCELDGSVCSDSTACNISISYPNSSSLITTNSTTNLGSSRFEFDLNDTQTATNGEYRTDIVCYDGGINGTSSFIYEINPTGIRPTAERTDTISRSIYFILIIGLLLFIGFLFVREKPHVKWTFFIFSILFFLIGINLIFVGLQDEAVNPRLETFFDSFTAISFYAYWFLAGLLIIMWAFTALNTWLYKKNRDNLNKYGGEY